MLFSRKHRQEKLFVHLRIQKCTSQQNHRKKYRRHHPSMPVPNCSFVKPINLTKSQPSQLRGVLIGTKKSTREHFFAHASKKVLILTKKSAPDCPLLSNCSRALFSHTQKHNNPALPNLLPPSATAASAVVTPYQPPSSL
jgi:hypothetical protein